MKAGGVGLHRRFEVTIMKKLFTFILLFGLSVLSASAQYTPDPVRFPGGVTNSSVVDVLNRLREPDPSAMYSHFNDFDIADATTGYTFTQVIVVDTSTNTSSSGLNEEQYGSFLIHTATDTTASWFIETPPVFQAKSGKELWYKTKVKLDVEDATNMTFVAGLAVTEATNASSLLPVGWRKLDNDPESGVPGGIYWRKDDGDLNLDFYVSDAIGSATVASVTPVKGGAWTELGIYYDGISTIEYWVDNRKYGTAGVVYKPTDTMGMILGAQNGEAEDKDTYVDYHLGAMTRKKFTGR